MQEAIEPNVEYQKPFVDPNLSQIEDEDIDVDDDEKEIPELVPSPELDQEIVEAVQDIIEYKQQRKEINANIQAVIERMEAKGIPRAAFKNTVRESEYTEDQRKAFDNAVVVTRRAMGIPVQTDLFERNKQ